MHFDVVTLFPEMFKAVTEEGITARAIKRGLWNIDLHNPREFVHDVHRTVDDRPFGGGPGMVMMAEPLAQAVEAIRSAGNHGKVISFAPSGKRLDDKWVTETVKKGEDIVLICGRYEGIDERFLEEFVDEQISIGDYVLSGGELPAMVLIDSVVRKIPGALKELSTEDESFATGLLDAPHYTRPEEWRGKKVPEVLMSGHHRNIQKWMREQSLTITHATRPELIKIARSEKKLTKEDEKFLGSLS